MRLIVIGGGVAGLAAARRARTQADSAGLSLDVTLLEASGRLGGKILTQEGPGGVPLEFGPDSFLASKPRARDLATELGLGDQLVGPGPEAKRVYLQLAGELRELPEGLALGIPTGIRPLFRCLQNGIIGPGGAFRAALEPLLPATSGDLTVAEFMRRRLGSQVAGRLIAPLVTGIFGAPPGEISMRAAFPQFADARSLVLAMARRPKGAGGSPFLSIRGGMSRLIDALSESIDKEGTEVLVDTPATRLARDGREFLVDAGGGRLKARAVLIASPATVSRCTRSTRSAFTESVQGEL
jgi:oxygen-dependent protoporphyrinogen oxidase